MNSSHNDAIRTPAQPAEGASAPVDSTRRHRKILRLTQYAPASGSASKWSTEEFDALMAGLPSGFGQEGLQGLAAGESAIVPINSDQVAVFVLDWFPPVVDDPYQFGAISAASALARLYATGAKPATALNIMALPCKWGIDMVGQVVRGGSDKVAEAGTFVVGGHSIDDNTPKYGLAVFGVVHPDKLYRNDSVVPGDVLFYSKPLGLGIMAEGYRTGQVTLEGYAPAVASMLELSRNVLEASEGLSVHGMTHVAERGLAGHLRDLLVPNDCSASLAWDDIELLEGAWDQARAGCIPECCACTTEVLAESIETIDVDETERALRLAMLCDPQTSGGVLVAVSPEDADVLEHAFETNTGRKLSRIGVVEQGAPGAISVR